MKRTEYIYLITLVLFAQVLFGQQLKFKHLTSEDGLSTNVVRSVMQDDLGFIWIGTHDGLNKYDGYQFRVFRNDPSQPASLSSSDITCLLQVKKDLILVGTRYGLNLFNPVTEKITNLERVDGRLQKKITCLFKADDDNILIGTEGGLFIMNLKNKSIKNPFFKGEAKVSVSALERVGDLIYVGTHDKGLWTLNKKWSLNRLEIATADYLRNRIPLAGMSAVSKIGSYGGKLYIGTASSGIYKMDPGGEVVQRISLDKKSEYANQVRDFLIRNNRIYAATAHGIVVYNLLSNESLVFEKTDQPMSLNANPCNCIYSDSENNFWIGTELGGVNISFFRSQKFPGSDLGYEQAFQNIHAMTESKPGKIILGGLNLLTELEVETGIANEHEQILNNSTVLSLAVESPEVWWVGTWGEGLLRYDLKTRKTRKVISELVGSTIVCLLKDSNYLYAGSAGDGVFAVDLLTNEVKQYTETEGLPNRNVNCIFKDSKRRFWLGTTDGGLLRTSAIGGKKLEIEKIYASQGKQGQIASNLVMAVNEDKNGNIWVATSAGLSKLLPDEKFHNFYNRDGLANTYLYSIVKDSVNNFWMSTNGGLVRFDPKKSESEITFKNYSVKDGLLNTEYNMGGVYASPGGLMYFGGLKGFNVFRPTTIRDNFHAPGVYVIGYTMGGSPVETDTVITYKKQLTLNWKDNFFQFELAATDFTDPQKNKFRYKLEGYDRDWSAPGTVRFVSYTELPGGNYTFKVKAANNDGIWNEKPFEINITVIPPFWKTKTFYFLVILVLLAAVYTYTQIRTRTIIKENKLLEQKVAERTKELEEKNKDITSSIKYAKRIQEAILPSREHIFAKLKKAFILYQPKDIVSGDFYWFAEQNGIRIFAVVDCTGHGVPGAFMSMIGHNLLHQIVSEKEVTDPGEILNHLHRGVQEALRQGQNEVNTNDGMDVSIIALGKSTSEISWAGANRPLVIVDTNRHLEKFEGDKFPIGGAQFESQRTFSTRKISVSPGSMAYMFTDGYADQFGGERGKKFMVRRFHDLLSDIHLLSPEEQRVALKQRFDDWRENHEQVDDVLIVGIEL